MLFLNPIDFVDVFHGGGFCYKAACKILAKCEVPDSLTLIVKVNRSVHFAVTKTATLTILVKVNAVAVFVNH